MSSIILGAWCLASPGVGGYFQPRPLGTAELAFSSTLLPCLVYLQGAHVASIHLEGAQRGRVNRLLCPPEKWVSLQERKSLVLPAWRVSFSPAGVLDTQGYRGTHESLGDPPSDIFWSGKMTYPFLLLKPQLTAAVLLDSGTTGLVTKDNFTPVSTIKSMSWSPIFKVTMGSRGPDVFEPRHPYSVSMVVSSATGRGLFSLFLSGHSFFQ